MGLTPAQFEKIWVKLSSDTAASFSLPLEEKRKLRKSNTARLIALIPFISESPQPERDAVSSLAIYILSIKFPTKMYYSHTEEDDKDIMQRLKNLLNYSGGNIAIQHSGLALLSLKMLKGYKRDMERDRITNKYNPLNSGKWDFTSVYSTAAAVYEEHAAVFSPFIERKSFEESYWEG
ncbi:MAG: hypothetical protein K9K80_01910 [Spirochaetia bacterium]|nr:hypothetical protein [Spirochaetia bacterium]MCF7952931.1 hypothetical protein [Spirochaetales bacterium]